MSRLRERAFSPSSYTVRDGHRGHRRGPLAPSPMTKPSRSRSKGGTLSARSPPIPQGPRRNATTTIVQLPS